MPFILEVQKHHPIETQEYPEWCGIYEHMGFMNAVFKTKKEAILYYDKHNPQMKSLAQCKDQVSDIDEHTQLRYIVRKNNSECLKIPPFVATDLPNIVIQKDISNNRLLGVHVKYPKYELTQAQPPKADITADISTTTYDDEDKTDEDALVMYDNIYIETNGDDTIAEPKTTASTSFMTEFYV